MARCMHVWLYLRFAGITFFTPAILLGAPLECILGSLAGVARVSHLKYGSTDPNWHPSVYVPSPLVMHITLCV
jgi:hypothetical protein